jgi:predicted ester cyclase
VATRPDTNARLVERAAIPGQRAESLIHILEGNRTLGARLFAPNYVQHKAWSDPAGKRAFRAKQAFPDLKMSVEDTIESGDRVVVRWRAQGTHTGAVGNIKPTGNKVDFTGITIYRFAGGRIVESWGQADIPMLAAQCQEIGPEIYEFLGAVRTGREVLPAPGRVGPARAPAARRSTKRTTTKRTTR